MVICSWTNQAANHRLTGCVPKQEMRTHLGQETMPDYKVWQFVNQGSLKSFVRYNSIIILQNNTDNINLIISSIITCRWMTRLNVITTNLVMTKWVKYWEIVGWINVDKSTIDSHQYSKLTKICQYVYIAVFRPKFIFLRYISIKILFNVKFPII